MDKKTPQFSWILKSDKKNVEQTAYQIQVWEGETAGTQSGNLLWDTGKQESGDTYGILYAGKELGSQGIYFWQTTVWDTQGEKAVSEIQTFETVFFDIVQDCGQVFR